MIPATAMTMAKPTPISPARDTTESSAGASEVLTANVHGKPADQHRNGLSPGPLGKFMSTHTTDITTAQIVNTHDRRIVASSHAALAPYVFLAVYSGLAFNHDRLFHPLLAT
jgi:hypothetical protein